MATYLDPEIDPRAFPVGTITADLLAELRNSNLRLTPELSGTVEQTVYEIDAKTGVTVTVHRAAGLEEPAPALFWIHGGGYVMGSVGTDAVMFDRRCPDLGIIGISIDYRLAPETPFPGPLDDVYTGLAWIFMHAGELGIDPARIGIGGVSAGAGLCSALALLVRDRGELNVQFQLLDCPMLDDTQTTPSSQLDDLIVWTRSSNEFGWRSYLGDRYGAGDIPAYAAAARATDLSNLPPAYVSVGTADGFRDENIAYASRLMEAGVPTELHVYPGAPHGVAFWAHTQIARAYNADQTRWLRRQFDALGS